MRAIMRPQAYGALFALLAVPLAARAAEPFGDGVYYLGDLHAHTGYSGDAGASDLGDCDGSCGALADVFGTARDNGLDFVAITDHVNGTAALTAAQFADLNARVVAANDPSGGFVTIPGAEVWFTIRGTDQRLGHKTLLLFGDDATVSGLTLVDMRPGTTSTVGACEDIWTWMDGLSTSFGDAMLIPHHPAVQMPMHNDWSCHDPTWEPAVEVYSEHGSSLHDDGYDTPGEGIYEDFTVHSALDPDRYGLSFGFVGGTDSHDTRPGDVCGTDTEQPTHLYGGGLTVAVLDASASFDRSTLHDAIRERRTYVTTGPALPMTIAWSAGGHQLGGLGDALDTPVTLDLEASVSFPVDRDGHVLAVDLVGPDGSWSLCGDGAGNWTGSVPAGEVPAWLYVAVEIDGAGWYGAGACADGGDDIEWLWGSPSTIRTWEDDADGDGASLWTGDCDDTDDASYPGAPETWYDGVDQDCAGDDDFDQDGDGVAATGWGLDCDDTDAAVLPGAEESWYDGVDQDCDGASDFDQDRDGQLRRGDGGLDCDDTDPAVATGRPEVWYDGVDQDCAGDDDFDQDGDGHRALDAGGGDCDDADPDAWPGAPEVPYDGVDQDCDGGSDADADGDGFDAMELGGTDCDDLRPEVHPGAEEAWYDGRDGDCDGGSDFDADGDGFDAELGGGADCDDTDAEVSPAAEDSWYDGVDQDCDGWSDWDRDRDGFDSSAWGGADCDDDDAAVSPANAEHWYDGIDQDCDPATEYDADEDGVAFPLDCDDRDPAVRACASDEPTPARGCSTTGDAAPVGALGLVALLLARRRSVRP